MLREEIEVLIIDDVNSTRMHVRELMKDQGFRKINLCAHGEEAKAYLEKNPCHLILCDWHMEPTNGIEVLKFVRSHPRLRETPFLMLTGEGTKERVIQAIQTGVDDYMLKPLTAAQIQAKVFGVLLKKKVL
jgi:two-component system, chemotaxis family, chemotaxis protein CheY